jgi:hypothetical protein
MSPRGKRWIAAGELGTRDPGDSVQVGVVGDPQRGLPNEHRSVGYAAGVDANGAGMPSRSEATDVVESAWQRVLREWEDEKAHKAFLMLCASTGQLAEAGRRYRDVRERDPERAEVAKAQIDRVLGLAMQSLSTLKTEPTQRSARTKMLLIAMGVSGAMIAAALWAVLRSA